MSLRIALVEPYFGGSHRAFAEGFAAASRHEVLLFTYPASFWKWRMQGGFLTLADQVRVAVAQSGPFDLVLATSMPDLGRFLGETRADVGDAPSVLYMHENQLTYPSSSRDEIDLTYAMTNWTSMKASDLVLFNSEFHRREWFAALPGLLARFPDERHTELVADVEKHAEVLPVGVDLARLDGASSPGRRRPTVLWNQRWEHDKGPDLFAAALTAVASAGVDFEVVLAGERFVSDPKDFTALRDLLDERVVHCGHADDAEYRDLLAASDIVVSTARQEFFGIAITEAVYAGAFPLLPDRLVYPERLPVTHHARCLYDGHDDLVAKLTWALTHPGETRRLAASLHGTMAAFDWAAVGPLFDDRLEIVAGG